MCVLCTIITCIYSYTCMHASTTAYLYALSLCALYFYNYTYVYSVEIEVDIVIERTVELFPVE